MFAIQAAFYIQETAADSASAHGVLRTGCTNGFAAFDFLGRCNYLPAGCGASYGVHCGGYGRSRLFRDPGELHVHVKPSAPSRKRCPG